MADPNREQAPGVVAEPTLRTAAGAPVVTRLLLTNTAPEPRILAVTALGVDASWLPAQSRSRPVLPGASVAVDVPLHPAAGTVPARYPLTVAVQALDPMSGRTTAPTAMAELVLVVDAPGQVAVDLEPAAVTAVFSRRIAVVLRNASSEVADVRLEVQAPGGARIGLRRRDVEVPAGATLRVPGRARVARPRLLGARARHAFTVTARGTGAPRHAQGALTARAMLGPAGAKAGVLIAIVAVWVAVAAILIPKLADTARKKQAAGPTVTSTSNSTGPAPSGGGSSGAGGGGASTGGAGTTAAASTVRLNGTVTGASPGNVAVSLRPTSLVDEQAEAATPVGIAPSALGVRGMVTPSALAVTSTSSVSPNRSTGTTDDGAWSFPGISAPGYYLLTFAKSGYQTQRYVINAAEADATAPLKVTLAAGQGRLSGTVNGPTGAVGGAQITITDGTNTITTSSNSKGSVGSWTVDGLSTPGSYLVTATKNGLGTESELVTLGAGGTTSVVLTLRAGVASVVGTVQGVNDLGATVGLGAVTVTATDGTLTRTASTVTSGPVGSYTLPGLPAPGTYTLTIAADGYQRQTRQVVFAAGQSNATSGATLTRSTATVTGSVIDAKTKIGQEGAGLVLANGTDTYKTLSGAGGGFRLNGVAPGTYVLSSSLFSYTGAFATVIAVAGRATNLGLKVVTEPNGGLPSTAQLRVQGVLDATTNAPISCTASCLDIAVDSAQADGFDPTTVGPEGYVVPETTDPTKGLSPGLHKVTVSAPGYEATTVSVQVPIGPPGNLGVTAVVPTVSLFPAPKLVGTITSVVGMATGVCVIAAQNGTPVNTCAAVDPTSGQYSLTLPAHGSYDFRVQTPSGSEYLPIDAIPITFGPGETRRYDAVLHRLGRIDVTVLAPDPNTGTLVSAGAVTVALSGPTAKSVQTGPNSRAVITGLADGDYDLTVPGSVSAKTTISVSKDQEPAITLTLVTSLKQIVGRVVTVIDGTQRAVAGVTVDVSGITGYAGTAPSNAAAPPITTDSNGCFAITPDGSAPVAITGVCSGVSAGAVVAASFVFNQVSVDITDPANHFQELTIGSQKVSTTSENTFNVQPVPVAFAGVVSTDQQGSLADKSKITVQVTRQASGSGTIGVTVAADGTLHWHDSNYADIDRIRPGTYTVSASLSGYAAVSHRFTCSVGDTTCGVPAAALVLPKLGRLVIVTASDLATPPTAVAGAVVTLSGGDGMAQTVTEPPGTDTVTFSGIIPTVDPTLTPSYTVTVQAAGYRFAASGSAYVTLSCKDGPSATAIQVSPDGTTTCTAVLTRRGVITGTVNGVLGTTATDPSQGLSNATVTAHPCNGSTEATICDSVDKTTTFTAVTGLSGAYRLTGTASAEGLVGGWWQITASAIGYSPGPAVNTHIDDVPTADNEGVDVDLFVKAVTLQVGVQNSSANDAAHLVTDATVNIVDASGISTPATPPATGSTTNLFVVNSLIPTTYTIQVQGRAIATMNVQVTLLAGVLTQTVYVRTDVSSSAISGTVGAVQHDDTAATPLNEVQVTVGSGTGAMFTPGTGTDNAVMTAMTNESGVTPSPGYFTVSTVPDGTFAVRFVLDGYLTKYVTGVVVSHGQAVPPLTVTMDRVSRQVAVQVTAQNGDPLTDAPVSLAPTTAHAAPSFTGAVLAPGTTAGVFVARYLEVPAGTYTVTITLGAAHKGSLVGSTTLLVSADQTSTADATAEFTIDEAELDLSVAVNGYGSDPKPSTVSLTVYPHGTTSNPTFSNPSFAVAPSSTVIWVPPRSYDIKADPGSTFSPAWPAKSRNNLTVADSATSTDGTVTLQEAGAGLVVNVTQANTTPKGQATVTLVPQDGQSVPSAYSGALATGSDFSYTFANLPPGNWDITAAVKVGATSTNATGSVTLLAGRSGDQGGGAALVIDVPS